MWLVKISMWKLWNFNVKWKKMIKMTKIKTCSIFQNENFLYWENFNASYFKFLNWWWPILFYFLTLIWHTIWIYIFQFSFDKCCVIISKVHYESTFSLNSSINFNMILNKVYYKMDNNLFDNVNVQYG